MKENKYDDEIFFQKYSEMDRSQKGLKGAGEWTELQKVLPDFEDKEVLDLGCGYGWHCLYAAQHGAKHVLGIDISERMLAVAAEKNSHEGIEYRCAAMEDLSFPAESFDIVISSLAFHYVRDFRALAKEVSRWVRSNGRFVFSVEHPVFTAHGTQDWYYDKEGTILHYPVDRYFYEGQRDAVFLGEHVVKYHRTLTTYLNTLLENGFELRNIIEPQPPEDMLSIPGMADEMRRPMMLIVSAQKKAV
ncbi:methyltransferase domain-containing protein [Cuneatibacter sp. NSJ-177]|uniref:class I SAM-dependent methyltransferase n=1 Tax=Cuneatibacter sp. NSJ-177 TaxID=2931401 RepID=UPI001FD3CEFF|nr:class I SAM-dependent methyltransferase [Cuneatibacter sp. NSJ-177]MCJ7836052.1 methyltransferase domain-containing protein [Cuneatibacter sp. NSJ-177]